jgi:hypothetical protein
MFDNILIWRQLNDDEICTLQNNCLLSKRKSYISKDKTQRIKAKLDNLKINYSIEKRDLKISGSISRYYFKNYTTNLKRKTTQKAIEKLENELKIDLKEFYIYRIELSKNILLNKFVKEYTKLFDSMPYLKKHEHDTGLTFKNKSRSMSIYDKKVILKKCRLSFNKYENSNLIKVEYRIKNKLKKHIQKHYKILKHSKYYDLSYKIGEKLKVKDLYEEYNYILLSDIWIYQIKSIKPIIKNDYNKKLYNEFITTCENIIKYYR